jgi:hypothetical protein
MFKRQRETRYGAQSTPRRRPVADFIAGSRVNCFNRKIYKLTEEHNAKVEFEVKKTLEAMKLKEEQEVFLSPAIYYTAMRSTLTGCTSFSVTFKTMKVGIWTKAEYRVGTLVLYHDGTYQL